MIAIMAQRVRARRANSTLRPAKARLRPYTTVAHTRLRTAVETSHDHEETDQRHQRPGGHEPTASAPRLLRPLSREPRIRLPLETRPEFVRTGRDRIALVASQLRLYLFPAAFPAVRRHGEAA